MSTTTIAVRVDSTLKRSASEVLEGLGLDLTTAIRTFLTQVTMRKAIPYEIAYPTSAEIPNDETIETIQWARNARSGKAKTETFNTPEELYADLGI
ncbi:MAG: type II toxin-antitoxin system RelB/DinJ family antitoxin [Coriobacteriales bacterium]|jgi:DNA-damage-inducible protein J|nr:type II toxin-antitoxin system RelB/DinJ family antitoxin [Coriobacteriales bacterium]